MKIWISSNPTPLQKQFKKGIDIVDIQKTLAKYVMG